MDGHNELIMFNDGVCTATKPGMSVKTLSPSSGNDVANLKDRPAKAVCVMKDRRLWDLELKISARLGTVLTLRAKTDRPLSDIVCFGNAR